MHNTHTHTHTKAAPGPPSPDLMENENQGLNKKFVLDETDNPIIESAKAISSPKKHGNQTDRGAGGSYLYPSYAKPPSANGIMCLCTLFLHANTREYKLFFVCF